MAPRTFTLVLARGDRAHQVEVIDEERVRVDDQVYRVHSDGRGAVRIAGDRTAVAWAAAAGDVRWVFLDGRVYEFVEERPRTRHGSSHHGSLSAPMPATVRRVLVNVGDPVKPGDPLVILEAMKMELPVCATAAGTIEAVGCREGELVQPGVTLIEIDES